MKKINLKRVLTIISVFGPAVLVSVELFDPASIVAATAAGAAVGLAVLWAAFYSGVLLIGIQEISARLGVVTGKTLAENIHQRFGSRYSFPLFTISMFLNLATLTAEIMGLSLALSFLFKIAYPVAIAISILLNIILVYLTSYDKLEKILIILVTAIFLSYVYFLFSLHANFGTIIYNSLVPSLKANSFYYAEAIVGASITPTYVILHSGLVYEKGWAHHHEKGVEDLIKENKSVRDERVDSFVSILMGTILTIIIMASAALLIGGKSVSSFADIAAPFSIKFGIVGVEVFAVAFAFAGILAVVTVGLGTVYSAFGFLGLESRIKARRFRLVFVIALVISAFFALIPNQIQVMVFTQYLNGLLLPFILVPLVIITRNKELMGKYKLGKATLTLAVATIVITTILFIASIASLL
ncbi:MAG: Nramp family divalent metal transporter [Candidatus Bathyarchaeia archaeon]|jgi:manganese transport protein